MTVRARRRGGSSASTAGQADLGFSDPPQGAVPAEPRPAALESRHENLERPAARLVTAPLSQDRYQVTFTASASFADKLAQRKALLGHREPGCDQGRVVELAVEALHERLRKERFGVGATPRRSKRSAERTRHVPKEVCREVVARDGRAWGGRAMNERLNRRMIGWIRARLPDAGLDRLTDPRREHRRRWSLESMLSMVLVGVFAGCRSLADLEALTQEMSTAARRALRIRGRMPDTTLRDAHTLRAEASRLTPWQDLLRWTRNALIAASDATIAGLRTRPRRPP